MGEDFLCAGLRLSTRQRVAVEMHSHDIYRLQLKEVRREVELSRRRSIKLKAQVDKLQESREGVGWSQHRERVKVTHMQQCTLSTPLCGYYNSFLLVPTSGHGGGSVRSAAVAPADRAGVHPAWTLSWGEQPGRCPGPAAECGPPAGYQPHQTGKGSLPFLHPAISGWVYFSGHVTWRNVCFAHTCGNSPKRSTEDLMSHLPLCVPGRLWGVRAQLCGLISLQVTVSVICLVFTVH